MPVKVVPVTVRLKAQLLETAPPALAELPVKTASEISAVLQLAIAPPSLDPALLPVKLPPETVSVPQQLQIAPPA